MPRTGGNPRVGAACRSQGRIEFGPTHGVVPSKLVNPPYINMLEQILRVDGSPLAVPINPGLL